MKAAFTLLAPLLLAACATTPLADAAPAPVGTAVALGQSVSVGALVLTPLKVVTDSRCPINARCVWAGELVVSTQVDGPGWREVAELKLGEPKAVRGTNLMLSSGEPGRMAGAAETAPREYRFTFE